MSWPRLQTAFSPSYRAQEADCPPTNSSASSTRMAATACAWVVCCKVGREHHVAFVSVPGSPSRPAANIEGLASSVFRVMGAPTASLVFWDVDRDEWDDGITIHRVEFLSLIDGRLSDPKWIP
jgi:hypothetical protein